MPQVLAQLLSGDTIFGPEEVPAPGNGKQLCSLLATVLPGKRLAILQGERRLGPDDCIETSGDKSLVVISVAVEGKSRPMPDSCTADSSQVINSGVLVRLVSDEYVFPSKRELPAERDGAPFIHPRTAKLLAGQEFWAVQATRKRYNECDMEDWIFGGQGCDSSEIHVEYWQFVDDEGLAVGWIMVARTTPRHLCFQDLSMPDAVFALTQQAAQQMAREAVLQDPKWAAVLQEKNPDEMSDMHIRELQELFRKHGLARNYMQRTDFVTEARAASTYLK